MPGRKEGRRPDDRDGPRPRPAPSPTALDRLPPGLLGEHRLAGTGAGGTRAALVGQLQRAAGNDRVQRLLAGRAVSRQAEPGSGATTEAAHPVVDDATAELAPGQMRRTPFLAALRAEVEGALASAGPLAQADARTHLPAAFGDLEAQDTAGLLQSLRHNLPGVEGGDDARRWIAAAGVAARARIAGEAPAAGTGVVGRVLSAVGGLVSALFKVREGGASPADARVVRSRLGEGRPLDGGVRGPMEAAYGRDFSAVRVHTDAGAGELSTRLGARAFTLGHDIAFSPGEYDPGSLVGNALIAHELAHVGQQAGGGGAPAAALEEDADRAAAGAVVSQWSGTTGGQIEGVMPRLRAGLRLQRCVAGGATQVRPGGPAGGGQACATLTLDQWRAAVVAAKEHGAAAMTKLAQQALCELGITVREAGTSHGDEVHPDDYAEIPVLNFDAGLNSKTRWRTSRTQDPEPIGTNVGYNFRAGKRRFAIIGPNSLSEDSPLRTRQYAQHELNLVAHDRAPGETKADEELATWTEDFRGYFHQYLVLKHNRPTWQPLIGYYAKANDGPKKQALQRLVAYYNSPPVPGDQADRVRQAMRMWMSKSSGDLIDALDAALPAAR
ncbi:MAG TPA: DUF4157 domain-containing protein [Acidimicrobiales bacterium]|nr:DUF4157 domain-containing protein [Acidimicrobiales bacterium]